MLHLVPGLSTLYSMELCVWWWEGLRRCRRWAAQLPQPYLPHERVYLCQWSLYSGALPVSSSPPVPHSNNANQMLLKIFIKPILCINFSSAVTAWMTVGTAVTRSAARTAPAPVRSSPARMECVSHQCMYVMVIQTVRTALMNLRACAEVQNPRVHLENSCAILGSALTSIRSATIKATALTTVMRRAVVRHCIWEKAHFRNVPKMPNTLFEKVWIRP